MAIDSLFIIDGISFCCIFPDDYLRDSPKHCHQGKEPTNLLVAILPHYAIRRLLVYVMVNIILTVYISQTQTTLPLYFSNFVAQANARGFNPQVISTLFTGHLLMTIACQIPILKLFQRFSHARSLMISGGFWALGFACITITGMSR